MYLDSARSANITFPTGTPPTPPALISGLTAADLQLSFERFASFLYEHASEVSTGPVLEDTLSAAIYVHFVSELIKLDDATLLKPSRIAEPTVNPRFLPWRCELNIGPNETLAQLIVRRYDEILALSPPNAYDFNLYLYIAFYQFVVWYCIEATGDHGPHFPRPGSSLGWRKRRLSSAIRDHVQASITYRWPKRLTHWSSKALTGAKPDATGSKPDNIADFWYNCFNVEQTINGQIEAVKLAFKGVRGVNSDDLVKHIRSTIQSMVQSEVGMLVRTLVRPGPNVDQVLLNGYGEFFQYGLGDGGITKGMFGVDQYGLLFFDYTQGDNWRWRLKNYREPYSLGPLLCEGYKPDTLSFFYYGVNTTEAPPSIRLVPCDEQGREVPGEQLGQTNGPLEHTFSSSSAMDFSSVTLDSWVVSPQEAKVELKTRYEELVFVVFRHSLGRRPAPPPISLAASWTYQDNDFAHSDEEILTLFADPVTKAKLRLLVDRLAENAAFDMDAEINGWGIGVLSADPVQSGGAVKRADTQIDTRFVAAGNPALRYSRVSVHWNTGPKKGPWLWIIADGFASPLRCTWQEHLKPKDPALGPTFVENTIGPFVPPDGMGGRAWNCALSAFRAFGLFVAVIRRINAEIDEMLLDDEISSVDRLAVRGKLQTYMEVSAVGYMRLPNWHFGDPRSFPNEFKLKFGLFESVEVQ